jgi:hypothetical protein
MWTTYSLSMVWLMIGSSFAVLLKLRIYCLFFLVRLNIKEAKKYSSFCLSYHFRPCFARSFCYRPLLVLHSSSLQGSQPNCPTKNTPIRLSHRICPKTNIQLKSIFHILPPPSRNQDFKIQIKWKLKTRKPNHLRLTYWSSSPDILSMKSPNQNRNT